MDDLVLLWDDAFDTVGIRCEEEGAGGESSSNGVDERLGDILTGISSIGSWTERKCPSIGLGDTE